MSVCVFMAFEDGEQGPESRSVLDQFELLDAAAEELNVSPISAFFDDAGMDAEIDDILDEDEDGMGEIEQLDFENDDSAEDDEDEEYEDDRPMETEWFPAEEGVLAMTAFIDYVEQHPGKFEGPEQLAADLKAFRSALVGRSVGWHFGIDY